MSEKTFDYYNKIGSTDYTVGGDGPRGLYYDGLYVYNEQDGLKDSNGHIIPRTVASDVYVITDANKTILNTSVVALLLTSVISLLIISIILLADKNSWGSWLAFGFYIGAIAFVGSFVLHIMS